MSIRQNQHAIVIGGSIAGLLAARVLSEYFQQVTIVDRDQLPMTAEPRQGVPQSVQPHVLFAKGYRILEALFPGIDAALAAAGAIPFDWGKDFLYFQAGRWSPTTETPVGLKSYTCTRPLLESIIRQQVSKIANIDFLQGQRVIGLLSSGTAIQGVKFSNGELTAQLVVDASGRSTHVPRWLEILGITPPPATVIDPGLGYATRRYRIPSQFQPKGKILLISQVPPDQTRLGYLAQVENNQWIATLGGYAQDYPPIEEQDFLQFAESLDHPAFYEAIAQAEPMSEIRSHRATMNRLYHYERIEMPEGLIAIGDAVCALCPIYGQGMTVSALASLVLQQWLAKSQKPNFQKHLARSNVFAWSLATASDSKFPTTKGAIAPKRGAKLFQVYVDRLMAAAQKDVEIQLAFLQMAHMLKPPSILFHPKLLVKALF